MDADNSTSFVERLNAVSPRVWSVLQFVVLLAVAAYGGHIIAAGHESAGMAIVTGSFALLKFEVGSGTNQNNS